LGQAHERLPLTTGVKKKKPKKKKKKKKKTPTNNEGEKREGWGKKTKPTTEISNHTRGVIVFNPTLSAQTTVH